VLGSEDASSDSALIGCVVHCGKRQLLPHKGVTSWCYNRYSWFTGVYSRKRTRPWRAQFLRLWGLALWPWLSFCSSPRQPDVHTCLRSTSQWLRGYRPPGWALLSCSSDSFSYSGFLSATIPRINVKKRVEKDHHPARAVVGLLWWGSRWWNVAYSGEERKPDFREVKITSPWSRIDDTSCHGKRFYGFTIPPLEDDESMAWLSDKSLSPKSRFFGRCCLILMGRWMI